MTTTAMFEAKRLFFRRLTELAKGGGPWTGVQVAYCWPGKAEAQPEIIYGGQSKFEHNGAEDLIDGGHRLVDDDSYFWIHIQVTMSPLPEGRAETSDERLEEIVDLIGYTVASEPRICGDKSEATIRDGQADYMDIDGGIVSHCSVQIGLRAFVDPLQLGS